MYQEKLNKMVNYQSQIIWALKIKGITFLKIASPIRGNKSAGLIFLKWII